jgi:hypothetical protein
MVGWTSMVPYKWEVYHRPAISLLRMRIFKGPTLVADSGNIYNSDIKGGRLGVYCFSQESVIWTSIGYACNSNKNESKITKHDLKIAFNSGCAWLDIQGFASLFAEKCQHRREPPNHDLIFAT